MPSLTTGFESSFIFRDGESSEISASSSNRRSSLLLLFRNLPVVLPSSASPAIIPSDAVVPNFAKLSTQPGTSLQPNSPAAPAAAVPCRMLSSAKPLPIHTRPLKPSCGNDGPNAAGRAKKAVEFSCVSVMMAFGGKREKGARKAKNDLIPVFGVDDELVVVRDWWEDGRERKVKNTAATKKKTTITARGSRMMCMMSRNCCARSISSPAAASTG